MQKKADNVNKNWFPEKMGKYGSERGGEIRNYFSKKNPQQSCIVLVLLQFANNWEKDFLNHAK